MVEELTLVNTKTNKSLMMNMNNADYLLYEGGIDWGDISVKHNTYQFVDQIGETITNTVMGTRDISINGWIVGKTEKEIFDKKEILSKVVNPFDIMNIIVNDMSISGKPSSNVTFSKTYKENNDVMVKFLIQIFCQNPLFKSKSNLKVSNLTESPNFYFPLCLKQEGIIFSQINKIRFDDVQYNGTVSTGCIFKLVATGSVNNPEIVNINTSEKIKINKQVSYGEVIEINTNKGERSIVGGFDENYENYIDYIDLDSTWMQLNLGTNTFAVRSYDDEGNEDDTYKYLGFEVICSHVAYNIPEE